MSTILTEEDRWVGKGITDAIVALCAEGGTCAPSAGEALTWQTIGDFAKSVWKAFPDVSLEIISIGDTGGGLVATQWVLHGTHTGRILTAPRLPVAPSPIRGAFYFTQVKTIRPARSTYTLTGRR